MAQRRFYRKNNKPKQNKDVKLDSEAMKISVEQMNLSAKANELLEKNNIKNAAELIIRTEKDMYKLQNLNKKVLLEIKNALKKFGLSFVEVEEKKELPIPNQNQPVNQNLQQQKKNKNDAVVVAQKNAVKSNFDMDGVNERLGVGFSSKISFLSSKCSEKQKSIKIDNKRTKEPAITQPLPVEQWKKIQRGNKWGFYDGMKTVIQPSYDEIFMFKEGLACVEKNEKCGFIDAEDNMVIPCIYETAFSFSEGLAVVVVGGKCGYIDKENKFVFKCEYEAATPFDNGVARIKKSGKWGFLNRDGSTRWN